MAPTLVPTGLNAEVGDLVALIVTAENSPTTLARTITNEGLPRIEVQIGTSAFPVPWNNRAFCWLVCIPKMATRGSVL
ncbi:hypothetical protein P3T33_002301 [Rhizobium sp. AN67]|nr:hypothetical protein [Rhizobium sp. AN67]SOD54137.1 hypothetical protein SAMN05216595_2456 [Rhizobium sp. AN6A]